MLNARLMLGDNRIAEISSADELEGKLLQIKAKSDLKKPYLELIHPNGNILGLAISPNDCYVSYTNASLQPPYYSSINRNLFANEDDVVRFMIEDHATYIRKRKCISFDQLMLVAKAFLEKGVRPFEEIEWEMD